MDTVVKSAKRVTEVFEFFAERRASASARDIHVALGYPQSSTSVLLHSLVSGGYLIYDPRSRLFQPTMRIALLGSWMLESRATGGGALLSIMQDLGDSTGDTILLSVQKSIHILYIQVIQASRSVRFYMKPGSLRPICQTSSGHALLSLKSPSEISSLVSRANVEREEDQPLISRTDLLSKIELGMEAGYFVTYETATAGAGAVAMPIAKLSNHPPLALGIGAPVDRLKSKLDEYVSALRGAMQRLEEGAEPLRMHSVKAADQAASR